MGSKHPHTIVRYSVRGVKGEPYHEVDRHLKKRPKIKVEGTAPPNPTDKATAEKYAASLAAVINKRDATKIAKWWAQGGTFPDVVPAESILLPLILDELQEIHERKADPKARQEAHKAFLKIRNALKTGKLSKGNLIGQHDLSGLGYKNLQLIVQFAHGQKISGGFGHHKITGHPVILLFEPERSEAAATKRNRETLDPKVSAALWDRLERVFKHEYTHNADEIRGAQAPNFKAAARASDRGDQKGYFNDPGEMNAQYQEIASHYESSVRTALRHPKMTGKIWKVLIGNSKRAFLENFKKYILTNKDGMWDALTTKNQRRFIKRAEGLYDELIDLRRKLEKLPKLREGDTVSFLDEVKLRKLDWVDTFKTHAQRGPLGTFTTKHIRDRMDLKPSQVQARIDTLKKRKLLVATPVRGEYRWSGAGKPTDEKDTTMFMQRPLLTQTTKLLRRFGASVHLGGTQGLFFWDTDKSRALWVPKDKKSKDKERIRRGMLGIPGVKSAAVEFSPPQSGRWFQIYPLGIGEGASRRDKSKQQQVGTRPKPRTRPPNRPYVGRRGMLGYTAQMNDQQPRGVLDATEGATRKEKQSLQITGIRPSRKDQNARRKSGRTGYPGFNPDPDSGVTYRGKIESTELRKEKAKRQRAARAAYKGGDLSGRAWFGYLSLPGYSAMVPQGGGRSAPVPTFEDEPDEALSRKEKQAKQRRYLPKHKGHGFSAQSALGMAPGDPSEEDRAAEQKRQRAAAKDTYRGKGILTQRKRHRQNIRDGEDESEVIRAKQKKQRAGARTSLYKGRGIKVAHKRNSGYNPDHIYGIEAVEEATINAVQRLQKLKNRQIVKLGKFGRFTAYSARPLTSNSAQLMMKRHGTSLPGFLSKVHSLAAYQKGRQGKKTFVSDDVIDKFDIGKWLKKVGKALDALGIPKQPSVVIFHTDPKVGGGKASGWVYPTDGMGTGLMPIHINRVPSKTATAKYAEWGGPRSPHTLAHEYAHQIWFSIPKAARDAVRAFWEAQINSDPKGARAKRYAPTMYSLTKPEEWWAEVVGYGIYPDRVHSDIKDFIQSVIAGKQYQGEPKLAGVAARSALDVVIPESVPETYYMADED